MPDDSPKIVTIDGRPIEQAIEGEHVLPTLKRLVADIESGKVKPIRFFAIVEVECEEDKSLCTQRWIDSDLTVADTVYMIEKCKWSLLSKEGKPG